MKDVRKLTIDRGEWIRGLFRCADGRMCALGHLICAYGVPPEEITDIGSADSIPECVLELLPRWLYHQNPWLHDVVEVNDGGVALDENPDGIGVDLSNEGVERRLRRLFATRGIELTFVGMGGPVEFTGERNVQDDEMSAEEEEEHG